MELPGKVDEGSDFDVSIRHYKNVMFELSLDTARTGEETIAPFEELVEFIFEQLRHNPANWKSYFDSIVKEFGSEMAQLIYVEVSKKAGNN